MTQEPYKLEISDYAEAHSGTESALLKRLDRETNLKTMYPHMLSGHLQGRFLKMITGMIKPKNILEAGTFTGYSTLCFAEALPEGGKIYTIEGNCEFRYISDKYFSESGMGDKIVALTGDVGDIVPSLDMVFDLAFIDADKRSNKKYYEMILPKVSAGGYILIDNVLWGGKVADLEHNHDIDTIIIDEFNAFIDKDPRVENVLLPFRDGIMMCRKV
ncbi:MAG: O-methyltransferase [Bacteroidales bacterium]|nr:O-methyltransferase [Bacteroidales bacterium]